MSRGPTPLTVFLIAVIAIIGAIVSLAIVFSIIFKSIQKNEIAQNANIVNAINSLNSTNQNISKAIKSIPIIQGPPGQNSTSTTVVVQQPVNGTNGASAYDLWLQNGHQGTLADFFNSLKGDPGISNCPQLQFDQLGNYRCHNSDDWLPLGL